MKTPREIYAQYDILQSLQLHQLRAAAVAKMICEHFTQSINARDVTLACLFHDMGNIIKSNLEVFPDFLKPKGREYWEGVKKDFITKYGTDEHAATVAIAREIGLREGAIRYIDGIGFTMLAATRDSSSYEQKICEYADLRVGPHGVLSLDERIEEARVRYVEHHQDMSTDRSRFAILLAAAREVEHQIFVNENIRPEDINDASVAPLIQELWEYPVS